ncbi:MULTISPECIES: signal peptidase I [Streptomyces]|uniref:Signal peptidase I n=1 Tax=Streptomyces viridochromogenes TaxID=1938 RepID=A0A0L8JEH2_STRVR|nr:MULTISPECIES: signal peptidase I [Streptomyces]KOG12072.1 signal peptidase I [Streptomyces viridochromogenes]
MTDRRRPRLPGRVLGAAGLAAAVGAIALLATGYTSATVSGDAMNPTYPRGDRVFFERVDASEVGRGDVVLHRSQDGHENRPVLRRVIGVGGDHVSQSPGGPVTVNGEPLTEPYVKDGDPSGSAPAYDVVVPEGALFLLGDHRANSNDSRYSLAAHSGGVPATSVQARALDSHTGLLLLVLTALLGVLGAAVGLTMEIASRTPARTADRT